MKKSRIATLIVFFVLIPLTLIVGSRLSGRAFYVTSTLVIVELLIPFFLAFEGRRFCWLSRTGSLRRGSWWCWQ